MIFDLRLVLVLSLALVAMVAPVTGQPVVLTTTFGGSSAAHGYMFDLQATGGTTLDIMSFDVNMNVMSGMTFYVYVTTAGVSYAGLETNASAWTLIGTATGISSTAAGVPTPLNLVLNYPLTPGHKVGFYVTTTATAIRYTQGNLYGALFASDPLLSFYQGVSKTFVAPTGFPGTVGTSPRIFNGNIQYMHRNVLGIFQSGPGVGDPSLSINLLASTAYEGWTLLSTVTAQPVGTGLFLGIMPDSLSFEIIGYPYWPGNPFHFRTTDVGFFPQVPFVAGAGSLSSVTGLTMDAVCLFLNATGTYDSRSNVVRVTFQ